MNTSHTFRAGLSASILLASYFLPAGTRALALSDTMVGSAEFVPDAVGENQAAMGLKEALLTSTTDAVNLTGRLNGYFENKAIEILLPQQLQPIATGLRTLGYGSAVDQFTLSMNRAAEAAAPQAGPIFKRAITNMSFTDAERIVSAGGHSATDYFKRQTSDDLRVAFAPIVSRTMDQYNVTKHYDDLLAHSQSGPFAVGGMLGGVTQNFDLNKYVTQKALDGLFYVMGQEEIKIRSNPAAQLSPLLRQVFGNLH